MSSYGAPDCPICGAHTDYCTLETPVGVTIDCRDLTLRNPRDTEWIRAAAWAHQNPIPEQDCSTLRNTQHATEGNP